MSLVLVLLLMFGPTPSPSPSPTPTPSPTAEPLRVNVRVANNETTPVHIYRAALGNASNFRYVQCVSFRNVATKVATDVDMSFVITNYRGETEADFGILDKGTFTPPTNIDNHCWYYRLWPKHVVKRMTNEVVRIKRVTFADGTAWVPGGPFKRGFANDGKPLPAPVMESGGSSEHGVPPPTSTSPLAAGGRFGAVFYEPGTYASGSAVDRPTAEAARTDAQTACNARTSGRNDCRLGIEFSRQRCGAIGVSNGSVEYGVGDSDRDARAMVLGKIAGAQIITVQCNSAT